MKKSVKFVSSCIKYLVFVAFIGYLSINAIEEEPALAQTDVVCPCNFDALVPKTSACWKEPFAGAGAARYINAQSVCITRATNFTDGQPRTAIEAPPGRKLHNGTPGCVVEISSNPNCGPTTNIDEFNLTPEELKACQCELLAYTTALNEVAGIEVSGGPPYVCGDVDVRTCQGLPPLPEPIPTLNEYGMIITAGILGFIGFMVIRRRKVSV